MWKRFFRNGKIDIHPIEHLEIGYSDNGPLIGLRFTLRCVNQDLFVKSIDLELVRKKDSLKHKFEWSAFLETKMTLGAESQTTYEFAHSFLVTPSLPLQLHIQFRDIQVQSEMRQLTNKVSEAWSKERSKIGDKLQRAGLLSDELLQQATYQTPSVSQELQQAINEEYENFGKTDVYADSYKRLERMCYWEAGEYSLMIKVLTSQPDRSFEEKRHFTLTDQEVETIRGNVYKLMQEAYGRLWYGPYLFAYPKFESE